MKNDKIYIKHLLEAIQTIEIYRQGLDFDAFLKNKMAADAIIRQLEIIGEASNNISEEFQKDHSDIPWRKIIGIRNTLIHEYFGVNKKVVWDTCENDLPELKKFVGKII
ncbi:MAG: DUF86 domain-containing protein [Candidatus Moranbacteria bacterium CG_4_9_14_3_um_filter_42_9]|nr:MAG: DUF86 domain-containing protein [Candidatus Moranbacteria bacterium CG_4_9_14_3_um_filter_42_9]